MSEPDTIQQSAYLELRFYPRVSTSLRKLEIIMPSSTSAAPTINELAAALFNLVDQIKEGNPIDDQGFPLQQYVAFHDAIAVLDKVGNAPSTALSLLPATGTAMGFAGD